MTTTHSSLRGLILAAAAVFLATSFGLARAAEKGFEIGDILSWLNARRTESERP